MVLSLDKLKLVNVNVIKPAEPVNTTFFEEKKSSTPNERLLNSSAVKN